MVHGPYRYTRNPMYLGVLTAISGWALLFQTGVLVGYLLLVGTGFHLFVVLYEEPHLAARARLHQASLSGGTIVV